MRRYVLYWLALSLIVIISCQKETSFETGGTPAEGSLQSDASGDCLPKTVAGSYIEGTALVPTTNTITVSVIVTKTGTWEIGTDTVNGYYFRGTGTFTTLGPTNITLRGNGTPFADGVNNFVVSYGTSICDIQVTVLPVGTGPATFTLAGAPGACSTPVIAGTYALGTPLNATNTVTLNVNVTAAGTYNVSTTATNGMTFSGTGTLATGAQTIVLTGSGTPTTNGANNIPVTVGSSTCNFTITVSSAAAFTLNGAPGACGTPTIAGTYTQGVALTATNTVTLNVNVTTAGAWSVTTAPAVNGMVFSGSGNFAATGPATIQLTGTGTPTTAGASPISVTAGSSTCTFTITVVSGGSAWTPDCSTATPDGLYEQGTQLNPSNTVQISVNVTATGPYNISTTATNGMVFSASGTFSATGVTPITLVGTGTPTAAGTFNIPMPGTTPCTFPITVDPPASNYDWQFTVTNPPPNILYRGQTDAAVVQAGPTPGSLVFGMAGSNSLGTDDLQIAVLDNDGAINAGDSYVSSSTAAFSYTFATGDGPYEADPTITGVTFTVNVTTHNVATKTITGTFSGTAKKASGAIITITSGTFTATYP